MQANAHIRAYRAALKGRRNGFGRSITVGAVSYRSITAFARSCAKVSGLGYMTVYKRLRAGESPQEIMARPARTYNRRERQLELAL